MCKKKQVAANKNTIRHKWHMWQCSWADCCPHSG